MPHITYLPDNVTVEVETGDTILETSLKTGIPHTHVCGGKARCTTCRVVILAGLSHCSSPRNDKEQVLADRLHFDPIIRLACQTAVYGDLTVRRLVLDHEDVELVNQLNVGVNTSFVGEEKRVAILFADIRGFTAFSEKQLPYDVIHVLNRYFHIMGQVISRHNGRIDNYMGDGLLAIFEDEQEYTAAYNAVKAGLDMLAAMAELQPYLKKTYHQQLQMGIGIHCGDVVMGTIGGQNQKNEMVIGDAVNFASRIESVNKEAQTSLLISQKLYEHVKEAFHIGKQCSVQVKGKAGIHTLYEVVR